MSLSWSERWDEVLSKCGQEDYDLLFKVSQFVDSDCYMFQSFRSFLDEDEQSKRAEEVLELFENE